MNNRKKGRRAELECKELLESEGWIVELIDMPKKYKKSQEQLAILPQSVLSKAFKGELVV